MLSLGGEGSCAEICLMLFFYKRAVRDGGLYIYTIYLLLGYEALECFFGFPVLDYMSCCLRVLDLNWLHEFLYAFFAARAQSGFHFAV